MPKRPAEVASIVECTGRAIAGGMTSVGQVAKSLIRLVTAARPDIKVNDSRLWSQNSVLPPNPRSLIIDRTKSSPYFSAVSVVFLFSAKVGQYCGEFSEISHPLLPMGMKTPICMPGP